MKVKSIAECSKEHSAILLTFIKLSVVIKTFVVSLFEWSFYTGFTVTVFKQYEILSSKLPQEHSDQHVCPFRSANTFYVNFYI